MLEANDGLSEAQKDVRARNTFLLALDGDVDFQPDAIVKLVSQIIVYTYSEHALSSTILQSANQYLFKLITKNLNMLGC